MNIYIRNTPISDKHWQSSFNCSLGTPIDQKAGFTQGMILTHSQGRKQVGKTEEVLLPLHNQQGVFMNTLVYTYVLHVKPRSLIFYALPD